MMIINMTMIQKLIMNDLHIYDWNTENKNLINTNKNFLIENIKNSIINKYLIDGKCLYDFFIYSLNKSLNKKSEKLIVKNIISQIKVDIYYDKFSPFIVQFFDRMKMSIEFKLKVLSYYQIKDNFDKELKDFISEFVNDFIGD